MPLMLNGLRLLYLRARAKMDFGHVLDTDSVLGKCSVIIPIIIRSLACHF